MNQEGAQYGNAWGTASEIAFIDGLGTWTGPDALRHVDRLTVLKSYQEGLALRVRWDNIHRTEVEEHLSKRIQELTDAKSHPQPKEPE
jgi:hypothetical protein